MSLVSCFFLRHSVYSTKELQTLELHPNCVSTLPGKTKKTKTAHLKSITTVFYFVFSALTLLVGR